MIRLESSGSDCTVEVGFRENSVYSTYTPYQLRRVTIFADDTLGAFARKLVFATNDASWGMMARYTGDRIVDRLGLVTR